jgi:hypothetical protein
MESNDPACLHKTLAYMCCPHKTIAASSICTQKNIYPIVVLHMPRENRSQEKKADWEGIDCTTARHTHLAIAIAADIDQARLCSRDQTENFRGFVHN